MLVEIKVPVLAESVADATLLDWHKSQGDVIRRGDNLIDLETDKVTLEVVAQNDGVLAEVRKQTGDTVVADEVLAVIDTDAELPAASNDAGAAPASAPDDSAAAESKPARAGPAARKAAQEAGVELSAVNGTGRDGRITKKDVLKVIEGGASEAPAVVPTVVESSERVEERVPMTRLRRRASERLLSAQRENAILTTFNEVNMQPVIDLRNRYRDEFEKQHDVKMGFMGFFVKAAIEALKRYPVVNASVDGDETIYHGYFDIGIAVGSERGLVVPILRDANYLSFSDIERRIRDFGERARDGKLTIDELTGGTFTITNGGVYGSLLSTPIINPPQSGILGMHKIQQRPVVEDGQILARPMMYLALSYDHRIIDGREAVQFLVTIKEQLEDPSRMLLQI